MRRSPNWSGSSTSIADGADTDGLTTLAENLSSVAKLLVDEPALTKHLAQPTDDSAAKVRLVERLFDGKVDDRALDICCKTAVSQRWSTEPNLIDAIEHVARLALLVGAERDGQVEEVEDQLFRFGRVLDSEPRLSRLLTDHTVPAETPDRVCWTRSSTAAAGSTRTAAALLTQTVELLRGEPVDSAVNDLAELAVARRGEVVAQVTAAADLHRCTAHPSDRGADPDLRPPGVGPARHRPRSSRGTL